MARIVTVYNDWASDFHPTDMADIRWWKISQALARLGHSVDLATTETFARKGGRPLPVRMGRRLRRVPLRDVAWSDYDVVKTLFHAGWETLERHGGAGHGLVVSKLGSVVAAEDRPGIYFYGERRERLYAIQERIARRSAYVTVLTEPARALWRACFGGGDRVLLVPGAVDRRLAAPEEDPFPADARPRCIFAGNVYAPGSQPEAHRVLVEKLNALGRHLSGAGIRLYVLGTGETGGLDPAHVTHVGAVPYAAAWNWLRHAHVGIVVAPGPFLHNNESTKIYHYLRVGLPVVSEAGFPNDHVVRESGLGFVAPNDDIPRMARKVAEALARRWHRRRGVAYVLARHTWDHRSSVYAPLLAAVDDAAPATAPASLPGRRAPRSACEPDPPRPSRAPDGGSSRCGGGSARGSRLP